MPPPKGVLEFLGLKGCTKCVTGCGCVVRAYCNLVCSAIGITIVIVAILYIALNPLDVLATIVRLLHFHFFFPLCGFVQKLLCFRQG